MLMLAPLVAVVALFGLVIPVSRGAEHQVTVGGIGVLKYDPEFVNADAGDSVIFTFKQKNHTVTQSSLNSPCSPLANGFDSGFVPVPDNQTDNFVIAQFTVQDTNPVWVYCRQANHCQQGMVFAINPGNKFDQFKNTAVGTSNATVSASVVTVTATVTVSGSAQTTTYTTAASATASGSATGTSTSTAAAHTVTVGSNGALTFEPSNLTAQVGEQITFQFTTKNHTATQSSFADPCAALSQTSTIGQAGFDSGFMPVMANATEFPTFTITVNDTAPIWVYCKQTNPKSHCQSGMVFSVNAPTTGNTFSAFLQNAMGTTGTSGSSASASSGTNAVSVSTGTVTAIPKPTSNGATSSRGTGALLALSAVALAHALL
ncbi:Cupredoxin [Ganoderma leucocontextum]|nr:Cupredoxin [Ganoderma leucocontextum]